MPLAYPHPTEPGQLAPEKCVILPDFRLTVQMTGGGPPAAPKLGEVAITARLLTVSSASCGCVPSAKSVSFRPMTLPKVFLPTSETMSSNGSDPSRWYPNTTLVSVL